MKKIFLFLFLFASLFCFAQNTPDLKKIDKYIAQAQKDWNVPGFAVAIVKDGEVIFEKGYGVRKAGTKDPIDEHTLFAIASNTKAFIATSIVKLAEEEKLNLKDPVIKHLPYFKLYDDYATNHARIEDLLSHKLGLGTFSGDVIWYKSTFTVPEVISKIQYIPQAYEFRGGYGYSNLMYITAGEVIHQASGKNWDQYIQDTFLNPLGMTRTLTTIDNISSISNVASPHKWIDGNHTPIPWATWNNSGAAGGIISSVHDMSQWMMLHLNKGNWQGTQIFSINSQDEMIYPHNTHKITSNSREYIPSRHFSGYGLGFGLYDMHGQMIVTHSGGYDGMYSRLAMMPDLDFGVVILTNSMTGIGTALAYYIMDAYSGAEEKDWSKKLHQSLKNGQEIYAKRIKERVNARKKGTNPLVSASQYVGDYLDDMYGDLQVVEQDGNLRLLFPKAPALNATLTHWHYDTYQIEWDEEHAWFDFGTVSFDLDNNLNVTGMTFDVPNDDIFFEEIHAVKVE